MKLNPIFAALTIVLSTNAYAAGESATQQRQSQAGQDRSMSQTQSQERSQAQSSDTVRKAQQALKQKGFDAGPADGMMGPRTQQAIKQFQESQANLKATGKLDQQTLTALGVEEQGAAMGSAPGTQRAPAAGSPGAAGSGSAKQK